MSGKKLARGDHTELAVELLRAVDKSPGENVIYDEGRLYRYVPSHSLWAPLEDDDASRIIQGFAGRPVRDDRPLRIRATDVKGVITLAQDLRRTHNFFADAPVGLSFRNGFLAMTDKGPVLRAKSRKDRQRVGFTYNFEWGAKSLAFESFLRGLFRDDKDATEKIAFLQEIFGAAFLQIAPNYQVCALLLGEGENGKDSLINLIRAIFPDDVVVSVPPHKWGQEYFRARLSGAWLNVISELPEIELGSTEAFKNIVAGGLVDARHPYGRVFHFKARAGHIFAANANMGTPDFSHGFFRRFGIVTFNRRFTEGDRDVGIVERLITTERAAITTWLVEGAKRLMARGHYVLPASHAEALADWKLNADQVAMFIAEKTRPIEAGERPHMAEGLYQEYATWAESNGHKRVSSTKFGTRAKALLKERGLLTKKTEKGTEYPITTRKPDRSAGLLATSKTDPSGDKSSNIIHIRKKM